MAEMNGQFSSDRKVEIMGDDKSKAGSKRIDVLEQENRQLVRDKNVMEKRIGELKQTIEGASNEKEKLFNELEESKAEIRALKSVAARASELEGDVARLQHELITATTALDEVNKELTDVKFTLDGFKKIENDKGNEFKAVVAERDLLIGKLGNFEAKENQYLSEMNEKEKEMANLKMKIDELKVVAGKNGDDKKDIDKLTRDLEVTVSELQRKLEDKERLINLIQNERDTIMVQAKAREIILGWPVIAGSVVCAIGFGGLVCYLRQAKKI